MADAPQTYPNKSVLIARFKRAVKFREAELSPRFEHEMLGSTYNEIVAEEGVGIVEYSRPV